MSAALEIDLTLFGQNVEGLNVPVGSFVNWTLRLQDAFTRAPINLTGSTVTMSVAELNVRNRPVQPPLFTKLATIVGPPANGVCLVAWVDGDTAPMPTPLSPGLYAIDVWLTDSLSNRVEMLVNSFLELTQVVTLSGSPVSSPTVPSAGDNIGTYDCPSGVAVLDIVYASGANLVDSAKSSGVATMPAVGFVISKPTAITCVVQYADELTGFVGLTTGATYFVSNTTAGKIAKVGDVDFPSATGEVVQRVGFARNATTIVIEVDRDIVVL
jgi:hypothetical protein